MPAHACTLSKHACAAQQEAHHGDDCRPRRVRDGGADDGDVGHAGAGSGHEHRVGVEAGAVPQRDAAHHGGDAHRRRHAHGQRQRHEHRDGNGHHHPAAAYGEHRGAHQQERQRHHSVPRRGDAALVHVGDVHQLLRLLVPLKGRAARLHPLIGPLQQPDLGKRPHRQQQTQQHHAQRIDHVRDGPQIILKAQIVLRHQPHAEGRPAGKRDGHAQAAGHDVGLQGQMLPGDAVPVGDLPHGERHRQGVEVLVHEHDHGHAPRQHQRPLGASGHPQQQVAEAHQGAGLLKQRDHAAEADDDAQHKLVRRVGQLCVQGVDGAGEEVLPVQQHHGQQRGQHHGLRHPAGLERIDDEKCQRRKGHDDLRHGAFSLPGKLSVV